MAVDKNRLEEEACILRFYKIVLSWDYLYLLKESKGCSVEFAEFEGRELHDHVVKMGFDCDVYVVNNLIYKDSVCGKASDARSMFDENPVLGSVSWNSMLVGPENHRTGSSLSPCFSKKSMLRLSREKRIKKIEKHSFLK